MHFALALSRSNKTVPELKQTTSRRVYVHIYALERARQANGGASGHRRICQRGFRHAAFKKRNLRNRGGGNPRGSRGGGAERAKAFIPNTMLFKRRPTFRYGRLSRRGSANTKWPGGGGGCSPQHFLFFPFSRLVFANSVSISSVTRTAVHLRAERHERKGL